MLRLDVGMTIFSDINNNIGGYAAAAYEYAFMEHFGAEAYLNTSIYHPGEYVGSHASRVGIGINAIGRLWGIKNAYDVKVIAGARYGSHFFTRLESSNGQIIASDGDIRSGIHPVFGVGYEQRLHDWVLSADIRASFESDIKTFTSLSLGIGYRF